jgi:ATP-dependent Clp protease ATP-binding subunit ClpA
MFERYTEKARRVIFFARYEASQYGSRAIESEHLLLGLLREDRALAKWLSGEKIAEGQIRAEIESRIIRGGRISTSVEMPLDEECKKILKFAAEEAERLGHRHVGTEHLLLGILRLEGSMAAQLLITKGCKPASVREQLAGASSPQTVKVGRSKTALLKLDEFLAGLKWHNAELLVSFFAQNAQFIDALGKRWNREEIHKEFATLLAPYAKKNATYSVEETLMETSDLLVATVLWKNAILASEQRVWMHRMTAVLITEQDDWRILSVHITPVQLP